MNAFFTKFFASFLSAWIMLCSILFPNFYYKKYFSAAAPSNLSSFTKKDAELVTDADFYVSVTGDDTNDGSFAAPFATIAKARDTVRTLEKTGRSGITIAVMAGEYRVAGLSFDQTDSGTADCPITYCAYGDGEVVLNGGITIPSESFTKITDESVLARLCDDAKSNVVCAKLTDFSLTAADWDKIYTIGTYNTAAQYDGDYVGELYCELFMNDTRMALARYPNEGFLQTGKVVRAGLGLESDGNPTKVENWYSIRNPYSDVYKLDRKLTKRISSWQTLDDVWMFGFWKYDWADASSPIGEFDPEARTISPKFVSLFGAKEDAPYYFFNVFEELDCAGEWYLERSSGTLYMYPTGDMSSASIDLSLTNGNIITASNVNYLTVSGFTVKGTRGDAISISGNGNKVCDCLIKNVAGYALRMSGYNNVATRNEITRTGKGGIVLSGGDRATLTAGNNIADNNLIHDWSEIYQTYQPAVSLSGVGNICSHNEIYNSPHEAITYDGNNHIIEYNNIHDVCLLSDDAGAIYAGRHWDYYGTVIRYNCIYDLGSDGHKPNGIYMDDALSGQTIYGNVLINIPQKALHLGGGRDLNVYNNIIINCKEDPVSYDSRARSGALEGGWFTHSVKDGDMWTWLRQSPWKSEVWNVAYPQMTKFSEDFSDPDSANFVPNPSYSTVTGNLILDDEASIGNVDEAVYRFSTVDNNAIYKTRKINEFFVDAENGDYTIADNSPVYSFLPEFKSINISEIGRY